MVRVVGLEPTLLAEPDFESGASTNSTTPAKPKDKDKSIDLLLLIIKIPYRRIGMPSTTIRIISIKNLGYYA